MKKLTKKQKEQIWAVYDACGLTHTFGMFDGTEYEEKAKQLKKAYCEYEELLRSFECEVDDE